MATKTEIMDFIRDPKETPIDLGSNLKLAMGNRRCVITRYSYHKIDFGESKKLGKRIALIKHRGWTIGWIDPESLEWHIYIGADIYNYADGNDDDFDILEEQTTDDAAEALMGIAALLAKMPPRI